MKVIFDIDGTICNVSKLLPLWETDKELFFSRLNEAEPIQKIIRLCSSLSFAGNNIYYYTARPERIRQTTTKWIKKNLSFYVHNLNEEFNLLMAKDNDTRHDIEIKLEMLRENDLTPDKVAFIVEDRTCVVEALRKAGYTVLQCADGDY